jgi:transcriptional regulator with XRE-family HTH domain
VFEIKYDFPVVELLDSRRTSRELKSRFYISEPPLFENHFLGLHVHEKVLISTDHSLENELQNIEIDVAIQYYEVGRGDKWGITA